MAGRKMKQAEELGCVKVGWGYTHKKHYPRVDIREMLQ